MSRDDDDRHLSEIKEALLGELAEWRDEQQKALERYTTRTSSQVTAVQAELSNETRELSVCVKHIGEDVRMMRHDQDEIAKKVDTIHTTMHGNGNPSGGCVAQSVATRRDVDRMWKVVKWAFAALAAAAITIATWWLANGAPVG